MNQIFLNLTQKQLTKDLLIDALSDNRHVKFCVSSNSMAPMLQPGDQVIVEGQRTNVLQSGDIVIYERLSELVIHRLLILNKDNRSYTKGDNHLHFDPPFKLADISGRVIKIIKGEKLIDLKQPIWITINRLIGWCGKWESSMLKFYHGLKRTKSIEISQENLNDCGLNNKSSSFIYRLLWLPYRFITRVVIRAFII